MLDPGTVLGPYEIISPLGAGGMGEVYKARDARLDRIVAVKVLPGAFASDPDRLARFEREAKAVAALSHPNILSLFDFGREGDTPYAVMELLEGESLMDRLAQGPVPLSKAVEIAAQVARGLSAAHGKGIVHRDLKPGNIFITNEGHVKILDFGLARVAAKPASPLNVSHDSPTVDMATQSGMILGTIGYMSPEQARGLPADSRSDIFSLGAVLYEMVSGEQAFRGETVTDQLAAVLREDPPPLPQTVPPTMDRILRQCLEKRPEERFSSAHDLALALEAIEGSGIMMSGSRSGHAPRIRLSTTRSRVVLWIAAAFSFLAVACAAAFFLGSRSAGPEIPNFKRLTFRRGRVFSARFASDGRTIVYSAEWDGAQAETYSVRLDGPESNPLGLAGSSLLAVSPTSELALMTGALIGKSLFAPSGTLSLAPFSGGKPRAIDDGVSFCDWGPDGKEMAVVRETGQGYQLEFPRGKAIYSTSGYISHPRISPDGALVAFLDHPVASDSQATVAILDKVGKKTTLTKAFYAAEGLAWTPAGSEVWFTAARATGRFDLYAVSLKGRERVVLRQSVPMVLHDVGRDGRALIANEESRVRLIFKGDGETSDRDLSWLDWSAGNGLTADGKKAIILENGSGSGGKYWLYIRDTDGSPPMKVGEVGQGGCSLSGDERWIVVAQGTPPEVTLHPVGLGQQRSIPLPGFTIERAGLLRDGKTLWFSGSEGSKPGRAWITDLSGSKPRPVTPEGITARMATRDGARLACTSGRSWIIYPLDGGSPNRINGILDGESVAGWGESGEMVFVYSRLDMPVRLYSLNLKTGCRELVREFDPSDRVGLRAGVRIYVTPDGKNLTYQFWQTLSELNVVEGLK